MKCYECNKPACVCYNLMEESGGAGGIFLTPRTQIYYCKRCYTKIFKIRYEELKELTPYHKDYGIRLKWIDCFDD